MFCPCANSSLGQHTWAKRCFACQQTPFLPLCAISVMRNSCMEGLVEQEAPSLRVPAGSWGTRRAAPGHGYCPGRAQVSPLPGVGYPAPMICGQDAAIVAFPCPSQPCHTTGCSRARSGPALSFPSTHSPRSPCPVEPCRRRAAVLGVATTTARVITSRKHISPRVCLLIPAGRVLVCVYGQQIPPTARSLSQNPPVPAGLALCRVLSPCAPALFPCRSPAPKANLRDIACATSAPLCVLGTPNSTTGNLDPQFLCSVGLSVARVQEDVCLRS